jgi:tetratricopeptide (TPR) repeat protein
MIAVVLFCLLLADPTAAELRAQAAAKFRAKDLPAAVELFGRAARLERLDDASRFTLAMALIAMDRRDEARAELEQLPPSPLHLYWLGRLQSIGGNYAQAIRVYNRALTLDPEFWRAQDGIGLASQAMGRYEEAQRAFRAAMKSCGGKSAWPAYNLGAMLVSTGGYAEAEGALAEALRIDPAFSRAYYSLGRIHELRGDAGQALANYRRAAADADDPGVFYALHRLLRKRGDEAGAQLALERFRQLSRTDAQRQSGR